MEKITPQKTFPKYLSIQQKTLTQIISNTTNKDKLKLLKETAAQLKHNQLIAKYKKRHRSKDEL